MLLELPTLKTRFIVHFATVPHSAGPVLPAAADHFAWLKVRGHGPIADGQDQLIRDRPNKCRSGYILQMRTVDAHRRLSADGHRRAVLAARSDVTCAAELRVHRPASARGPALLPGMRAAGRRAAGRRAAGTAVR
jgi:hypothetical protein